MFSFVWKVFRAYKISRAFEEAWDLVARGQVEKAEVIFESTEEKISTIEFEQKIQKGYIKFKLDKWEESYSLFKDAWSEIGDATTLSEADKLYLRAYIYEILAFYNTSFDFDIGFCGPFSSVGIPMSSVSDKWKERFPSRGATV